MVLEGGASKAQQYNQKTAKPGTLVCGRNGGKDLWRRSVGSVFIAGCDKRGKKSTEGSLPCCRICLYEYSTPRANNEDHGVSHTGIGVKHLRMPSPKIMFVRSLGFLGHAR